MKIHVSQEPKRLSCRAFEDGRAGGLVVGGGGSIDSSDRMKYVLAIRKRARGSDNYLADVSGALLLSVDIDGVSAHAPNCGRYTVAPHAEFSIVRAYDDLSFGKSYVADLNMDARICETVG